MKATRFLTHLAAGATSMLAGMSLDQSVKQLPARHEIGIPAFTRYSRAADLANGVALYATFGVAAALLTIGAALLGRRERVERNLQRALDMSAALALVHSFCTANAAPANWSQLRYEPDETRELAHVFNRFERWQTLRTCALLANVIAAFVASSRSTRAHAATPAGESDE